MIVDAMPETPLVAIPKSKAKVRAFVLSPSPTDDGDYECSVSWLGTSVIAGTFAEALDAVEVVFKAKVKEHRETGDLEEWLNASGARWEWKDTLGNRAVVYEDEAREST